ncbi:L-rhamnose mutarotase [Actinoplanes rectilineatus]|uniref:L-rhamnose mutarotase n=1 Tax=Actinoplanes rectilineatus TaxID=113571 RepID=UPI0005F2EA42|nr:L-rhamnose mutarotase [Actinoplanes rectilineatus]
MTRHGQIVNLRPERRAEYLRLHAAVWPQVEATLTRNNIRNYTIFLIEDTLIAYYEHVGEDHDADMAAIAADPATREWWTLTDPCQAPWGAGPPSGAGGPWRDATEVWHLD